MKGIKDQVKSSLKKKEGKSDCIANPLDYPVLEEPEHPVQQKYRRLNLKA